MSQPIGAPLLIGVREGLQTRHGRKFFAAVLLAAFALSSWLSIATLAYEAYAQRSVMSGLRGPVVDGDGGEHPPLLMQFGFDTLADGRQFSVVRVAPDGQSAPKPPGVASWPAVGDVIMSPELINRGSSEGIETRYGRVVAQLPSSGLADAGELLAYVVVTKASIPEGVPVTGFGFPKGEANAWTTGYGAYGSPMFILPLPLFLAASLLLGLPAIALLTVALGVERDVRRRRDLVLHALGAGPNARRWRRVGIAFIPSLFGACLGAAAISLIYQNVRHVPLSDFVTGLPPLTSAMPTLLGSAFIALLVTLAFAMKREGEWRGTRASSTQDTGSNYALLSGPIALVAAVEVPGWLFSPESPAFAVATWLGVVAATVLMPVTVAGLVSGMGYLLERLGRHFLAVPMLLGGAWMKSLRGSVLRTTVAIFVLSALMTQGLLWSRSLVGPAALAQSVNDRTGSTMLVVNGGGTRDLETLRQSLKGMHVLEVAGAGNSALIVSGDCAAIRSVGQSCANTEQRLSQRLSDALYGYTEAAIDVIKVNISSAGASGQESLLLISSPTQHIDVPGAKQAVFRSVAGSPQVFAAGGSLIASSEATSRQGRWITLFGILGLLVVFVALVLDIAAVATRVARRATPILAVTSGGRALWWSLGIALVLPGLVAAGLAVLTQEVLALSVRNARSTLPGPSPAVFVVPVVFLASLVAWITACLRTRSGLARWRPGRESR